MAGKAMCPKCGAEIDLKTAMKLDGTVTCRRGHTIRLRDKTGATKRTKKALDDLQTAVSRLGTSK